MTDNEIIKALEYCLADKMMCEKCPIQDECESRPLEAVLAKYSLNLINRQQEMIDGLITGQETLQKYIAEKKAEIERLKEQIKIGDKIYEDTCNEFDNDLKTIKVEAIKEFAKAYKDQIKNYTGIFTDEGFYVSHEAVLDAVDFVLDKKLEELMGDVEWQ